MPLHWAACLSHCSVAELLLSKGAMLDAVDVIGRTPADWADDTMARMLTARAEARDGRMVQ